MAKLRKKEKKKGEEEVPQFTLDSALKTSKKTESTLQGLLKAFSEEESIISQPEKEKRVSPQLSYENKKQIAEDYMMENVPITERPIAKRKTERTIETSVKTVESKNVSVPEKIIEPKEKSEPITKKEPSISKKDNVYLKLTDFFEESFQGYSERYDNWENSISSILAILRKMRKITKKNTEDLVTSINNLHVKIQDNLEIFKMKRDEVEKIAGIDIESMSSEFKKALGLLELQVKEYQLKKLTDEYVHQHRSL